MEQALEKKSDVVASEKLLQMVQLEQLSRHAPLLAQTNFLDGTNTFAATAATVTVLAAARIQT